MGKKYSAKILATPGLRNYWRLGTGTSSPETSIGPLPSALTHVNASAAVPGLVGDPSNGARNYNGIDQWSNSAGNSSWNGAAAGSMECWFKENALVDWAWIIGTDNYPAYRFQLLRRAGESNLIIGYRNAVAGTDVGCIGPYTPLAKTHVGATFGAHGTELIVNGVLVASDPTPCEAFPSTCTVVAAGNGSGSGNIVIDEYATYNVRVPVSTFAAHYKAGMKDKILSGLLLPV